MAGLPRVVVSVTASVDGRLTPRRESLLLHERTAREWEDLMPAGAAELQEQRSNFLEQRYGPGAHLEGSGSLVPESAGPRTDLPVASVGGSPADASAGDFLPEEVVRRPGRRKWFTVVDSRGRVRWRHKRHDDQDLLVLVARNTPVAYRAYLRAEGICHLVAGDDRVDLEWALRRLRAELNVNCVVVTGGGALQGALLRAGLIDEVHLIVAPVLIGGSGTPALFDGTPLGPGERATGLRLVSSRAGDNGMLWLHYEKQSCGAGRGDREKRETTAGAGGGR